MDHEIIKRVAVDMQDVIQNAVITDRDYTFEENVNYILVGVRRAGKSTLLYKRVRELVARGVQWEQIFYINFEDDRLMEFTRKDFDDLIESANEFSDQKLYYFFDEIQNVDGWEKFARRMADHHEYVCITGSNAKMLGSEMAAKLGGRYITMMIMPFSLKEILRHDGIAYGTRDLLSTVNTGRVRSRMEEYLNSGGLPETLNFKTKRIYIQNVYDKVLLGDIIARNKVMNPMALRLLIKKIAETVMHEISYNKLAGNVKATGVSCSTDAIIRYVSYAEDACLLFRTTNYVAKFSEKEGTPRFYFIDNGFLSLFLIDKPTALLENAVAVYLHRQYQDRVYYYKSSTTGIDLDFFLPDTGTAIQVSYALDNYSREREIRTLVRFAQRTQSVRRCIIVTHEEEDQIEQNQVMIEVMPLYKFLLQ